MSGFRPIVWAQTAAPVADVEEFAILSVMAGSADEDGCNAFQAIATIAKRTRLATRTVQRRIDAMLDRGLITLGDQSYWKLLRIPERYRPLNYDLMIPHSWWGEVQWAEMNTTRGENGRPPLHPEDRPDLPDAPTPEKRVIRRKPKDETPGVADVFDLLPDDEPRGDPGSGVTPGQASNVGSGVTPSPIRGDSESPNLSQKLFPKKNLSSSAADAAHGADADSDRDLLSEGRADVEDLCAYLADFVERTSEPSRRPRITKQWRRDARLMLDKDGIDLPKAKKLIDWIAGDSFWSSNILSIPTFRKQYEPVRRKALAEWERSQRAAAPRPSAIRDQGYLADPAADFFAGSTRSA